MYDYGLDFVQDTEIDTTVGELVKGFKACCSEEYEKIWNYVNIFVLDDQRILDIICIYKYENSYDIEYDFSWITDRDGISVIDTLDEPGTVYTNLEVSHLMLYLLNRLKWFDDSVSVIAKFYRVEDLV